VSPVRTEGLNLRAYTEMILHAEYRPETCEYYTEVNGCPMTFDADYAHKYGEQIALQLQLMANMGWGV